MNEIKTFDDRKEELVNLGKENGYVTGFAIDICQKDNTRVCHTLSKEELYDHQFTLCDPNEASLNCPRKKCLYGNLGSYYLYEYILQVNIY